MTNKLRSGSIQSDVPVNPVCPYARVLRYLPQLPSCPQVSQPSARVPSEAVLAVNSATALSDTTRTPFISPPFSIICANTARSLAVLNRPAWPATPPSANAFSRSEEHTSELQS